MDTERIDMDVESDEELNRAFEAHIDKDLEGLSVRNQRVAKIDEFEEAALSRSDPFAAIIGLGNATIQRVFEHLGAAIVDKLDSKVHTVEEIREISPEIRLFVKLRNSIEMDFKLQLHDSEPQSAEFRCGRNGKLFDHTSQARKHAMVPKHQRPNG